ncbi:MAG: thymidine phosphorylase [Euryarchaeota archaeon]
MSNLIQRLCDAIENGQAMDPEDLSTFIQHVAERTLSVEHITQWLRTVHKNGISSKDTVLLTKGMMHSGAVLTWDPERLIADKHSTGGVGDKMSLMLAPALAACGVEVPMLAGRGLGHTGGTIDKLEAIPGFSCELNPAQMQTIVDDVGCCIAAQNEAIAPADGLLYAIRDVTNTVDSIPLITASIVSKKAAEGLKALVLDVKCGRAAFMTTQDDARSLAASMVGAAKGLGIQTIAQITDMNEPIGSHVGNALEILESIEVLNGRGSADTVNLVAMQGGALLMLLGLAKDEHAGEEKIIASLKNGKAALRFERMCVAQGVTKETASQLMRSPQTVLPQAKHITQLLVEGDGFVEGIDAMTLAEVARTHGAGRFKLADTIDAAVGFVLSRSKGDQVLTGQEWLEIHHNQPLTQQQNKALMGSLTISKRPILPLQRLIEIVE